MSPTDKYSQHTILLIVPMFSLEREDHYRRTALVKSNLLTPSIIDIDSLVKCVRLHPKCPNSVPHPSTKKNNKVQVLPQGRDVQPATRIRFTQLSQQDILIPNNAQVQTHIVNVSFGVSKRKTMKNSLRFASVDRPFTGSDSKKIERKRGSSRQNRQSELVRYAKLGPEEKYEHQLVNFNNSHLVTTISNTFSPSRGDISCAVECSLNKPTLDNIRRSAPLEKKKGSTAQELFLKRRLIMSRKDHFVFSMEDKRGQGENKVEIYRDFLWKVNFSNGLYVDGEVELKKPYKVYVGNGNNSSLIKILMKRKFWWVLVDKITNDVNFVWTQLKVASVFANQQPKYDSEPTQTTVFTTTIDETMDTRTPPKTTSNLPSSNNHLKIFNCRDMEKWRSHCSRNPKSEGTINEKTYFKRLNLLKKKTVTSVEKPLSLSVHNHFQSNYYLGNKKAMFYSLRLYYSLTKQKVFEHLPLTFHIRKGVADPEYKQFLEVHESFEKEKSSLNRQFRNIWILKPGEFTNRGKGITVCASLDDIVARLKGKERNADNTLRTFIIQKYIERPFLYHRRKFDIRHYMLMTCVNGKFKGYWYQEGYIRTTSTEYNLKNCRDTFIHLTNDAVQKNCDTYGKYEKGNKLSYQEFQRYLDNTYPEKGLNFQDKVVTRMKTIATDAIKASYSLLDVSRLSHNFEVFGLDFMIDESFNTYLIEINTNPCLELSSPLLSKLIPSMISNALLLGLDPIFPPPYDWPCNKKYQLFDNPLENNKFQLVFDETIDGAPLVNLYSNVQKVDQNMGNIDEEEEEYPEEESELNEELI